MKNEGLKVVVISLVTFFRTSLIIRELGLWPKLMLFGLVEPMKHRMKSGGKCLSSICLFGDNRYI